MIEISASLRVLAPPTRPVPSGGAARSGHLRRRCRGASADPSAQARRGDASADPPRRDPDPGGARLRALDGARRAAPAAARRPLRARPPGLRPAPEARHGELDLARLPRTARSRPGGRCHADPARDPEGEGLLQLQGDPRRLRGPPALPRPAQALPRGRGAQGLPEPALPPRHEQEPVGDPRGHVLGEHQRLRPGNQDRRRRRRRRHVEPVLQPRRLLVSGGLPEGRARLDDAQGDRRPRVPGPRLGAAGPARALAAGLLPRDPRRRESRREWQAQSSRPAPTIRR